MGRKLKSRPIKFLWVWSKSGSKPDPWTSLRFSDALKYGNGFLNRVDNVFDGYWFDLTSFEFAWIRFWFDWTGCVHRRNEGWSKWFRWWFYSDGWDEVGLDQIPGFFYDKHDFKEHYIIFVVWNDYFNEGLFLIQSMELYLF